MAAVSLSFNQKISDVSDQLNMICTSFQEGSADSSKIKQMFSSFVDRVHQDYGSVFEHAVYYNLWRIKKEPIGDFEYGRNSFHDIGELCSSAQEKVDAIRIVYLQIKAYLTHPNLLSDLRRVSSLYQDTKPDDAKALFIQITDNAECRVIRDLCCYNLWKFQGKPEGCPTFGEDCFMDKIPTKTSKKVKAIGLLFKRDAVVAYLERNSAQEIEEPIAKIKIGKNIKQTESGEVALQKPQSRMEINQHFYANNSSVLRSRLPNARTERDLSQFFTNQHREFGELLVDMGARAIVSAVDYLINGPDPKIIGQDIYIRAPNGEYVQVDRTKGDANEYRDTRYLVFSDTKGERLCFGLSVDGFNLTNIYGEYQVWRAKTGVNYSRFGFVQTEYSWFDPRSSSQARKAKAYDFDEAIRRNGYDPDSIKCLVFCFACFGFCFCLKSFFY